VTFKTLGHLAAPILFFAIAIWGYFQLDKMPKAPTEVGAFEFCQ